MTTLEATPFEPCFTYCSFYRIKNQQTIWYQGHIIETDIVSNEFEGHAGRTRPRNRNQWRPRNRRRGNMNNPQNDQLILKAFVPPVNIPPHVQNLSVTRLVRADFNYTLGSTASVSAANIAGYDQSDYGSSSVRYAEVRVLWGRVWGPVGNATQGTAVSNSGLLTVQVSSPGGIILKTLEDTSPAGSTKPARVGWRWGLIDRGTILQTSNAIKLAVISFTIPGTTSILNCSLTAEFMVVFS